MVTKFLIIVSALLNSFAIAEIWNVAMGNEFAPDFDWNGKPRNPCAGISCLPPPPGLSCRTDPKDAKVVKEGIEACCPQLECQNKDGIITRHKGFSGIGSSGSSYSYGDPSTGSMGQGYSKSFSSSSYSSSGNVESPQKAFQYSGAPVGFEEFPNFGNPMAFPPGFPNRAANPGFNNFPGGFGQPFGFPNLGFGF